MPSGRALLLALTTIIAAATLSSTAQARYVTSSVEERGGNGPGLGQFVVSNWGLAGFLDADPSGTLAYVPDHWGHRINVYSLGAGLNPVATWGAGVDASDATKQICAVAANCQAGSPSDDGGGLVTPGSAHVAPDGTVWVADSGNHRLVRYASSGAFVAAYGTGVDGAGGGDGYEICTVAASCKAGANATEYTGLGDFSHVADLRVLADRLVVVDDATNHVQVLRPPGSATAEFDFGATGTQGGQFNAARGVAVDPRNGDILVTDRNNHRYQRFNASGTFIRAVGWDVAVGGSTGFEKCVSADTCKAGVAGAGLGQLDTPHGIEVDEHGYVYVGNLGETSGANAARVQKFDPSDSSVTSISLPGGAGQPAAFKGPRDATVLPGGDVLVSDTTFPRIVRIKAIKPVTAITTAPTSPTADATPSFAFSANPNESATKFQCRLDGGLFAACPAAYTTPELTAGEHRLDVRAIDGDGIVGDAKTAAFTILPPPAPPTPPPAPPTQPGVPTPAAPGQGTSGTPPAAVGGVLGTKAAEPRLAMLRVSAKRPAKLALGRRIRVVLNPSVALSKVRITLRDRTGRKHVLAIVRLKRVKAGRSYVVTLRLKRKAIGTSGSLSVTGVRTNGKLVTRTQVVAQATA